MKNTIKGDKPTRYLKNNKIILKVYIKLQKSLLLLPDLT